MAGGNVDVSSGIQQNERLEMLIAFDQTRAGVKGLVDSGITKVPQIFVSPAEEQRTYKNTKIVDHKVPLIDLSGFSNPERRKQMIEQVRVASETWGFFQVVNHGIPQNVLDGMIDGIRGFHEQDVEEKKKYYTREPGAKVRFICNTDLFSSGFANWRDSVLFSFPDQINSQELPPPCRESTVEYVKHVLSFGNILLEILSEGLGLKPDHLKKMDCSQGLQISAHYFPACPEPELTLGTTKHTDPVFLTILLQDQMGGLQVLYKDQWVDIQPIPGALVINIGDLLQLVSNEQYISVTHRVLTNSMGPRISVALFYSGPMNPAKHYGPIKELISEKNPAKYKDVTLGEYTQNFLKAGLDEYRGLDYYKV